MVNTEEFIKRLEIILDYYSLNASTFADKIGVQRSSLSHLLSGRNKPSLDFILKILDVFPDVDLYWILNGKGTFPKNTDENALTEVIKEDSLAPSKDSQIPANLFSEIQNAVKVETKKTVNQNTASEPISGEIEKIVLFYKNGTFKVYQPT